MRATVLVIACCLAIAGVAVGQQPPQTNPYVEKIVKEISAKNIQASVEKLVSFGTRHTLSDTLSETRGIGATRRWIKSEFERYGKGSSGRLVVEFQESTVLPSQRVPTPTRIVNVLATLKPAQDGLSAGRTIIVSGHYDTRASSPMDVKSDAPGADDDGSGVALVLELARVMSKYEFDVTIIFGAFAVEEQGLFGATALADWAKRQSVNVEAVFNNDMVGSTVDGSGTKENGFVRLFSEAFTPLDTGAVLRQRISLGLENDGGSRTLARYIKEIGERYNPEFGVQLIYRLDRFLRGGDHRPFHERGFRAVRFCEVKENYDRQHQDVRTENGKEYGDLPKFVDYEYCAQVARVNAAGIATLGRGPQPPTKVEVLTARLENDSELRWQKNPEGDLAGYLVRYRQTSSPVWEHSVFTADTTIALKVSKDDFLFGVQAVDKEGNASLVTLPRPSGRQ
ncbi:MAG: M20/M25/M40 family metallo-hydrolase [Ignavibacteriales bacterium]|nr:M20/M25/M40 family metallo-hydrolase [Ignavibacteriales bacterium]